MNSKRYSAEGASAAKQQREDETTVEESDNLKALVKERSQLLARISTLVFKENVQKAQNERLENAYKACIEGLKKNMEVLVQMQINKQLSADTETLDAIDQKLDQIFQQGKDLSEQVQNIRPPADRNCKCSKEEVENFILAQKLLVEEFQLKTFEHEQIRLKLMDDLKRQEEVYSKKIELLQMNLDGTQVNIPSFAACPICLDPWTSSGGHRSVSLACGHVFGDMCIRLHLDRAADCPLCRAPACLRELRNTFLEVVRTE